MIIKKLQLLLLLTLISLSPVFAQKMIGTETDAQKEKRMEWWKVQSLRHVYSLGLVFGRCKT